MVFLVSSPQTSVRSPSISLLMSNLTSIMRLRMWCQLKVFIETFIFELVIYDTDIFGVRWRRETLLLSWTVVFMRQQSLIGSWEFQYQGHTRKGIWYPSKELRDLLALCRDLPCERRLRIMLKFHRWWFSDFRYLNVIVWRNKIMPKNSGGAWCSSGTLWYYS